MLRVLAEKREHERDVLFKAMEENSNFSRMAEEKLQMKMEQSEENRLAYLSAMMERLQEKVRRSGVQRRILGGEEVNKWSDFQEAFAMLSGGIVCTKHTRIDTFSFHQASRVARRHCRHGNISAECCCLLCTVSPTVARFKEITQHFMMSIKNGEFQYYRLIQAFKK